MPRFTIIAMAAFISTGCTGPRSGVTWFEARCVDQYGMKPGTAEFTACVSRERAFVEETQARVERSRP